MKNLKLKMFITEVFRFTYKEIEDSQLGTVLFSECFFQNSHWNYIEFDLLSGRMNLLDEDMIIKESLKLSLSYDKADQNIRNCGAGVCEDSVKCSC